MKSPVPVTTKQMEGAEVMENCVDVRVVAVVEVVEEVDEVIDIEELEFAEIEEVVCRGILVVE